MAHDPDDIEEPPQLRRLRWLVSGLMVALIVGVLAIAGTIVIRLGLLGGLEMTRVAAPAFNLPESHEVVAVGRGEGAVLFVLRAPEGTEALYSFDQSTGEPIGVSAIVRSGR